MKLYLAVPRQSSHKSLGRLTRPARTREWIARLPLLNTRESLQQIRDALHDDNRTEMRVARRLKVLDMYRPPLKVIRSQVETRLGRGAAPLSENDLTMVELFHECCIEMAYGYKAVILEIAQSRARRQMDEMRVAMGRALFYLEQTIFACALYRQAPVEGTWLEIHTIYFYARTLRISEDVIKDPAARAKTSTSISLIYRRVLLFGLSDPFHQSIALMGRVLAFLKRHAQDAELRSYASPPTERCQFVIQPETDYPAQAHVKQPERTPGRDALLLDTLNLTRRAHDQLKRLESAEQVDVELDDEFKDDLGRKLLAEVVRAWGVIPRRDEARVAADGGTVEVMAGIPAAGFCVNGEKPFELSSPDRTDHSATAGTFQMHLVHRRVSSSQKLACRVVDRADSGLRLSISYAAPALGSLKVGDVIASRGGGGAWTAGLIRWLRCVDDSIHFGVMQLRQRVTAAAVKPIAAEREEPFKEGLLVRPDEGEDPLLMLITPPGLYGYQRNLFVDDGTGLIMARGRRLLETNPNMEWFECEMINL